MCADLPRRRLVVTPEGFPVAYEVFDGDTADVTTLEEIVDKIETEYGMRGRVWVFDRGIVSEDNLQDLRQRGAFYLVGTPRRKLVDFERELLEGDWQEIAGKPGVRVQLLIEGAETFVLARSLQRAKKESAILRSQLTRLVNRLESGNNKTTRAHKIQADHAQIETLLIRKGVGTLDRKAREVVIDLDSTDDPLHGSQEGRFFHGYYGNYFYLPLYAFIGEVPVWAELRNSQSDASKGSLHALQAIVAEIRRRCPHARIIVRRDNGFYREALMAWCEEQQPLVYYCFGLARNSRLLEELEEAFFRARAKACLTGGVAREFVEFQYQTRESWSRARRVIGKADVLHEKNNPRFIVTNLPREGFQNDAPERLAALQVL